MFSSSAAVRRGWPRRRARPSAARRCVLVDEGPVVGGQIWRPSVAKPSPARRAAMGRSARARAARRSRRRRRSSTFSCVRRRVRRQRERRATGALRSRRVARFSPRARASDSCRFPDGRCRTSLASAARRRCSRPGCRFAADAVVIAGSGPLLLPVAASLARGGRESRARRRAGTGAARCALRGVALAKPVDARAGGAATMRRS